MNEPTHDPIVTLRLELARVTDQRDAYEKSLRTEVLKLLEQVTVSVAVATDKEVSRLKNENAFLKAEVERLKNNIAYLDKKLDEELDK
jgi:cell division protein FtsB